MIVHVATDALIELDAPTSNVIAETPTGRDDRTVVVVGAHLDSVRRGPRHQRQRLRLGDDPRDRACRWPSSASSRRTRCASPSGAPRRPACSAREYYVDSAAEAARRKDIALNLNFDMVGSPNFVRFVYDGDGSRSASRARPARAEIEQTSSTTTSPRRAWPPSRPRSTAARTTAPFITAGIPAGGLFTGAEGIKTAGAGRDLRRHAGGEPYDPCYHQACDTMNPIADGADADLYEALNASYGGALEYNG